MTTVTLQQLHEDLMGMKKELTHIRTLLEEEFELVNDVAREIEESRNRPRKQFISHEEMRREFQ